MEKKSGAAGTTGEGTKKQKHARTAVRNPPPAYDPANRTLKSVNKRHGPATGLAEAPAPAAVPQLVSAPVSDVGPGQAEFAQMTAQFPHARGRVAPVPTGEVRRPTRGRPEMGL